MDNEKKIGIAGLAIFCVGLGLLFFVFYLAYQPFHDPTMLTFVKTSPTGGEGEIFNRLFTNIILVLVAISLGALAIMGGAAGKIASKGIGLFKSRKS